MLLRASALVAVLLTVVAGFPQASPGALVFNFTPATGMASQAIAGFAAGGQRWASLFSDDITININIGLQSLGTGILAQAGSQRGVCSYASFYNALNLDRLSASDAAAIASLPGLPPSPTEATFGMLINRTSDNPNGSGSATPYLDNDGDDNNAIINMTTANAKALGLLAANDTGVDATITFSSAYSWDFDPTDGILADAFDFVGIAAHEIGHALGFVSGVDVLDNNAPLVETDPVYRDDQFTFVAPLDMFRYSAESKNAGVIDWTADTRNKYFSLDNGVTSIALFSEGATFGDGRQASHWKDGIPSLGIMDPTGSLGELLAISQFDILAMDVIGYDLAVPEPATWILLSLGSLALIATRRTRSVIK
jgi:hypothetical protein